MSKFKTAFTKMGLLEEEIVLKEQSVKPSPVIQLETKSVEVDPEIVLMLKKALDDSKLAGFDYMKFVSAVEEMKSFGTPEETRFKMAFFTAKQLGVDKDGLVKSGNHYLAILKEAADDFKSDCTSFEKKEVKEREKQSDQFRQKIIELNNELVKTTEELNKLSTEIDANKATLETKQVNFNNSLDELTDNIKTNIEKITNYL